MNPKDDVILSSGPGSETEDQQARPPNAPGCIVIGPMKAGTTWIDDYLRQRGDVVLPQGVKETMFFDHHFDRGLDWYLSHFDHSKATRGRAVVEVAPSYFHNADAPGRILQTLGTVRLIAIRRDPIARSWSHYLHMRRYGMTRADFRTALQRHPEILAASRFDETLATWRAVLPPENLLVLEHDHLREDPVGFAARLCSFIGLPPSPPEFFETLTISRNAAALPRFPALAGLTNRVTFALRRLRLYGIINFLKKIGLKKFLFGAPEASKLPQMTPEERAFLQELLEHGDTSFQHEAKH